MTKHYDILQVRNITDAIHDLADEMGVNKKDLEIHLNLDTFSKVLDFVDYCRARNYSVVQIMARKLNDIAIDNNLRIRFIPPKKEEDSIYGI